MRSAALCDLFFAHAMNLVNIYHVLNMQKGTENMNYMIYTYTYQQANIKQISAMIWKQWCLSKYV